MKTRFSFKRHISHSIFVYLFALILVPIATSYFILLKTNPKDVERFSIFIDTEFKNEDGFRKIIEKTLPEDLLINTYGYYRDDSTFNTYLSAYGLNSDICILSKTTLDKFESISFVDFTGHEKWDRATNYIYKEEKSIGVLLHEASSIYLADLLDFEKYDDDYYLLALSTSVHLEGITSGKTNQVDRVFEALTNLEYNI